MPDFIAKADIYRVEFKSAAGHRPIAPRSPTPWPAGPAPCTLSRPGRRNGSCQPAPATDRSPAATLRRGGIPNEAELSGFSSVAEGIPKLNRPKAIPTGIGQVIAIGISVDTQRGVDTQRPVDTPRIAAPCVPRAMPSTSYPVPSIDRMGIGRANGQQSTC
jgi:hypothetical protein